MSIAEVAGKSKDVALESSWGYFSAKNKDPSRSGHSIAINSFFGFPIFANRGRISSMRRGIGTANTSYEECSVSTSLKDNLREFFFLTLLAIHINGLRYHGAVEIVCRGPESAMWA